jgi:hypothetical protein
VRVVAFLLFLLAPASARAQDYGIYAGLHLGAGHSGDDIEDAYQTRTVGTVDLQFMPGLRFSGKSILVGLLFDARFLSQISNVDKTAVGDFGGSGLTIGPGVVVDFTKARLLLSWDWRDRQSVNAPDGTTFKGSGFHLLAGYRMSPLVTVDLEYVIAKYNTIAVNDAETDVGDHLVKQNTIGVGVSVSY